MADADLELRPTPGASNLDKHTSSKARVSMDAVTSGINDFDSPPTTNATTTSQMVPEQIVAYPSLNNTHDSPAARQRSFDSLPDQPRERTIHMGDDGSANRKKYATSPPLKRTRPASNALRANSSVPTVSTDLDADAESDNDAPITRAGASQNNQKWDADLQEDSQTGKKKKPQFVGPGLMQKFHGQRRVCPSSPVLKEKTAASLKRSASLPIRSQKTLKKIQTVPMTANERELMERQRDDWFTPIAHDRVRRSLTDVASLMSMFFHSIPPYVFARCKGIVLGRVKSSGLVVRMALLQGTLIRRLPGKDQWSLPVYLVGTSPAVGFGGGGSEVLLLLFSNQAIDQVLNGQEVNMSGRGISYNLNKKRRYHRTPAIIVYRVDRGFELFYRYQGMSFRLAAWPMRNHYGGGVSASMILETPMGADFKTERLLQMFSELDQLGENKEWV
eukprot:comp6368_c0_seq1/m.2163 comp6368_c0_seq1/g.2163  ORF comp6368_c0_seq1/g.2163 comp6368_c0_seq1/m.2163 type:complete len:446 (-) comp6368_c0_seq1:343-1680(-)